MAMTPKQEERLKLKIKRIKSELAADKRRWGGYYDDSRGLRYLPPELYIRLGDYSGGLRYVNWFEKNFPDDCGFPAFLFEWTVILFKTGRRNQAVRKAFQTFCANTYLLDQFLGKPITPLDKYEGSNLQAPEYLQYFDYSYAQPDLLDFSQWLNDTIQEEEFQMACKQYISFYERLKYENDTPGRMSLIQMAGNLERQFG